ncbi:Glutamate--cysteine ligase [Moorella humiferrea]|uniref:Glutamate--cysteine ligase n=1 Tax=Neomoorella humiferrea TaxID=676965 RepID=A0A2T0AQA8_9FIRM|nr:hypothetical protein [Moorella humiferrea]PRR71236.1 Glutamate--cysteine ligase [Moorella humiferrea]
MAALLFGLEEEVFITEPERPTLQSLYYLSRLLWQDPADYYTHTACNFTRGKDLRFGLMSGIEISTGTFRNIPDLLADLRRRRRELAGVCPGLIVPVGHLFDREEPTNVSGMHVHISGFPDRERAYRNLVYFLPLLALLSVNSPIAGNRFYGCSYRWAEAFAIGPLREDRRYRFQDLIESKRLGTLEIRVFDPVWDLDRIRILLECIQAILLVDADYPGDIEVYNRLRLKAAKEGYVEELRPIYRELTRLLPLPEDLFRHPPAEAVKDLWLRQGTLAVYSALDNGYRNGLFVPRPVKPYKVRWPLMIAGFCGYYLPKMPYNLKKVWSEW